MIDYPTLRRSFQSLLMHRMRTLLSTLGVLFGVAAVIAMLSIGEGAKQETLEQIEQLGMKSLIIRQNVLSEGQQQKVFEKKSKGLTEADGEALKNTIYHVIDQAPVKVIQASINGLATDASPEILGVTRSFAQIKNLQLAEGRFVCDLDCKERQLVCVLGYKAARCFGEKGHAGQTIRIENAEFQVAGVLKPTRWKAGKNSGITTRNLDKIIFLPLGAEKALPMSLLNKDQVTEIILQIDQPEKMDLIGALVKKILARLHGGVEDYQIIIPQELFNQARRTQVTFNWVLGSIAAISLLVGGIGIMNIMLATVTERTREIGIRRAVGATRKHIMVQFLLETLLLTLSGALLGIACGIGFSLIVGYVAQWKTIVTFWSIFLSIGMSCAVGLFSGLYPAYQAAMMDPIKALRHY
jgi:putative ABC transport system permease protein